MDDILIEQKLKPHKERLYESDDILIFANIQLEFEFMLLHILPLVKNGALDWHGVEFKLKYLNNDKLDMELFIFVIDGLLMYLNYVESNANSNNVK